MYLMPFSCGNQEGWDTKHHSAERIKDAVRIKDLSSQEPRL